MGPREELCNDNPILNFKGAKPEEKWYKFLFVLSYLKQLVRRHSVPLCYRAGPQYAINGRQMHTFHNVSPQILQVSHLYSLEPGKLLMWFNTQEKLFPDSRYRG